MSRSQGTGTNPISQSIPLLTVKNQDNDERRKVWGHNQKRVDVTCMTCKKEERSQVAYLKKWFGSGMETYVCYSCRKKGRDELQEASIAIYRRKQKIKGR